MASQLEIAKYLSKIWPGWVTMKMLELHFKVHKTNINRQVNQMHKYKVIQIIVDGRTHLIRLNRGEIE